MKTILVTCVRCIDARECTKKGKLREEYHLKFEGIVDPECIEGDIRKGPIQVRLSGVGTCMMRVDLESYAANGTRPNCTWGMSLPHTIHTEKDSDDYQDYMQQVEANRAEMAMYRDRDMWCETFEMVGDFVQRELPFATEAKPDSVCDDACDEPEDVG